MTDTFDWREATEQALQAYHHLPALEDCPLGNLLVARKQSPGFNVVRLRGHECAIATQKLIDLGLSELAEIEPHFADFLDKRFRRRISVKTLQQNLHTSKSVLYERQNRAIDALVSILIGLEAQAVAEANTKNRRLIGQLPHPSYQQWLGEETDLLQIHQALDKGWGDGLRLPLFVTGIGGVGKTSLAREAIVTWLQTTEHRFERIVWTMVVQPVVSLTPQLSNARKRFTLEQVLADLGRQLGVHVNALPDDKTKLQVIAQSIGEAPTLLVLDNVETPDETLIALRLMESLPGSAQLLVTSRYQITSASGRTVTVHELSERNARRLLLLEVQRLQLSGIGDAVFGRLYQILGGHPHALKLAVAQLAYLPVEQTLRGFREHSSTRQMLFRYIYDGAWSLLSLQAQDLMLGLWLLPLSGATWDGLRATLDDSGLSYSDGDLQRFLRELTSLNLVQTTQDRPLAYSLHRLTYGFLSYKLGFTENELAT